MTKSKPETEKQRIARAKHWRAFRQKYLLTQVVLSELLGVVPRTVQGVENAERSPSVGTLSRFAALERTYRGEGR